MTQPDGTVSQVLVRAYRAQHVAGLQTGPGAGRARGQRDVLESHEEALAIHTGEGEVDTAGVAGGGAAVADNRLKVVTGQSWHIILVIIIVIIFMASLLLSLSSYHDHCHYLYS